MFPYDLDSSNDCLSDTSEKIDSNIALHFEIYGKTILTKSLAHLKLSSIRNDLDLQADIVKEKFDILMPSESKLWEYLSGGQFLIKGFDISFCLDQNRNGNYMGFMVFI